MPIKNGMDEQNKAFEKLQVTSDSINYTAPNASLKGALLQFPAADGYAIYVVTKDKPLTLGHVNFCDGYTISAAHLRGLNRQDILNMLHQRKLMKDLFSKTSH